MKEIASGIYVEDSYPGVLLGAVIMPKGTLMIDAPPRPDDGRSWQAALRSMGTGTSRLLLNLDSHPDRTLGNRAMDSTVIAQEQTVNIFDDRSAIFKAQIQDSGAEWEYCSGLSGIRWLTPNLFFTTHTMINWGEEEILIEHHPGPEPGACWVIVPSKEIMFIGDAVVIDQPPFLENADINAWLEALDLLSSAEYKNYTIISGRGGEVLEDHIREQKRFLKDVEKRIERLGRREVDPDETEKMVPKLLSGFDFPESKEDIYTQRLRYGLYNYYVNHYKPEPEEE